jgi:hypothetical protein
MLQQDRRKFRRSVSALIVVNESERFWGESRGRRHKLVPTQGQDPTITEDLSLANAQLVEAYCPRHQINGAFQGIAVVLLRLDFVGILTELGVDLETDWLVLIPSNCWFLV